MTRYGQRENGHVPGHLALRTVTADEAAASTSPLLALLGQIAEDDGTPWEPVPPGEEFPWMFADRDGKVPNVWTGPLRPPEVMA